MAVRVKLRIRRNNITIDVIALVNSGYEADTPQLMIPLDIARELKLWPPPPSSRETIFETAGGPLRVWIIPKSAYIKVITDNVSSREVLADLVISALADEPLISDMLAGALEIAVEDFALGLWRFRWEPKEKVRESEKKV